MILRQWIWIIERNNKVQTVILTTVCHRGRSWCMSSLVIVLRPRLKTDTTNIMVIFLETQEILSPQCWDTQSVMLRYPVHNVEIPSPQCWDTQSTISRYSVPNFEIHSPQCWDTQSPMLRYSVHNIEILSSQCWDIQSPMLRYSGFYAKQNSPVLGLKSDSWLWHSFIHEDFVQPFSRGYTNHPPNYPPLCLSIFDSTSALMACVFAT